MYYSAFAPAARFTCFLNSIAKWLNEYDVGSWLKLSKYKMAVFGDHTKIYFPIKNIQDVVRLFEYQMDLADGPNLTLLSIILGTIENALTINRNIQLRENVDVNIQEAFPVIELSTVEALYDKFKAHVAGSVDLTLFDTVSVDPKLVNKVSDVIWNSLARSYHKDREHLQYLFSYLTG